MHGKIALLAFALNLSGSAWSTEQITGLITLDGEAFILERRLPLPEGDATTRLYRGGLGCTAGYPQGRWLLKDGKVLLVGIASYGTHSLHSVYGQT